MVTHLQQVTRQLQSRLDQQPKLGSDTDISFWVVSHNEVRPTGQVLGEGGWGRVVVGSFRGPGCSYETAPLYHQLV